MGNYLKNIYISISQLGNTVLAGYPDESFSARCYRKRDRKYWGKAYRVINAIFFWQHNHCYESYVSEKESKHLPDSYK